MTRKSLSTLVITAALTTPVVAREAPADWVRPCPELEIEGLVWCGRRSVLEDAENPQGPSIEADVVIAAASRPDPEPDPLFFFAGGPGLAATQAAASMSRFLRAVRVERDLVFVDHRGTGGPTPLHCSPPPDAPLQEYLVSFLDPTVVARCRRELAGRAQLHLYGSPEAAADAEAVRRALGYDSINLLGVSYGGRAALVYLRRYPRTVRSVVLKGPAPPHEEPVIFLRFAPSTDRGLEALLAHCAASPPCHTAYPRLRAEWEHVVARVRSGQVRARVRHPVTGAEEEVRIPAGLFADGVRRMLYYLGDEPARRFPVMVHVAYLGDFGPLAQTLVEQGFGIRNQLALGPYLAVTCGEDVPFVTEGAISRWSQGTFLGDYRARQQVAACVAWDEQRPRPAEFRSPVESDVPALVLSGALDTASSPEAGEQVVRHLSGPRLHVVFPAESHGMIDPECEIGLIVDFLERGGPDGLDVSCANAVRRPEFLLD